MKRYSKTKKSYKKSLVPILGLILVALLVGGLVFWRTNKNNSSTANPDSADTTVSGLDLSPPTEADREDVDQHKADISEPEVTPAGNVSPVIIDASQYDSIVEVRAYVPGITENGGNCNLVFSNAGKIVTKQTSAFADATTTACSNIEISTNDFPNSGTWVLKLTYSSASYSGSVEKNVEIQK